jgi:hypothetical protein
LNLNSEFKARKKLQNLGHGVTVASEILKIGEEKWRIVHHHVGTV